MRATLTHTASVRHATARATALSSKANSPRSVSARTPLRTGRRYGAWRPPGVQPRRQNRRSMRRPMYQTSAGEIGRRSSTPLPGRQRSGARGPRLPIDKDSRPVTTFPKSAHGADDGVQGRRAALAGSGQPSLRRHGADGQCQVRSIEFALATPCGRLFYTEGMPRENRQH